MSLRTKLNPLGGKSTKGVFTPKVVCATGQCRFIDKKGDLYSSGANDFGQQGSGNTSSVKYLTKRASKVIDVKCSDYISWYLDINNNLYGCGSGTPQGSGSQNKILTYTERANNVKDFFVSNGSTWYIDLNNDLYGCGYNNYGQQGTYTANDPVLTFAKRASNVIDVPFIQKEYGYTTFYVQSTYTWLWRCGLNDNYQLGNGNTSNYASFIGNTHDIDGNKAIKIITTKASTYYLTSVGDLYATGNQTTRKFGTSGNYQYFTKIASNVKDFYGSHSTTWYITNNGDLYGCGYGYNGEQGTDVLIANMVYNFTKRAENVKCVKCASTDESNIEGTTWYLTNNNELYGTGYNGYGQQGAGNTTNVFAFTKRAENVIDFDCTPSSTYYIDSSGDLYGCGYMVYTNSTSSYSTTFENLMPYLQS